MNRKSKPGVELFIKSRAVMTRIKLSGNARQLWRDRLNETGRLWQSRNRLTCEPRFHYSLVGWRERLGSRNSLLLFVLIKRAFRIIYACNCDRLVVTNLARHLSNGFAWAFVNRAPARLCYSFVCLLLHFIFSFIFVSCNCEMLTSWQDAPDSLANSQNKPTTGEILTLFFVYHNFIGFHLCVFYLAMYF